MYCFSQLRDLNYEVISITSDKHSSLISSVKEYFRGLPHQYCLVHIQLRCETLLTKRPNTEAGRDLLQIVSYINQIKTEDEKNLFFLRLWLYEYRYEKFLNERSYAIQVNGKRTWWYTHKNVRKAFRHIDSSLENMFHYLNDPNIAKDTNGLEGGFTHFKTKLNIHRGLKRERRINYVCWYWYLKSTQKFN